MNGWIIAGIIGGGVAVAFVLFVLYCALIAGSQADDRMGRG